MKENEKWDGANVDKKTYAILMGLTLTSTLSSIAMFQMIKPDWFQKIPKWEVGSTSLVGF